MRRSQNVSGNGTRNIFLLLLLLLLLLMICFATLQEITQKVCVSPAN
jgi:hypothetical protein